MRQPKIFIATTLAFSLAAAACGNGTPEATTGDQAKAMSGVFTKLQTLSTEGQGGLQRSQLRELRKYVRKAQKQAEGQFLLNQFAREAGLSEPVSASEPVTFGDDQISCTFEQPDEMAMAFSLSCTTLQDDTMECGSTTYTLEEGGTMAMDFSTEGTAPDLVLNYAMDMNMTISGGEFGDGTEFDCNWGFTFTQAQLAELESGSGTAGMNCESIDFSCTIGGAEVTCEDLNTAMVDDSNACS
jgi:hypothetical protein